MHSTLDKQNSGASLESSSPREIRAIVFDAFGTLCEIRDQRRPFTHLARKHADRKHAREVLMTRPLGLRDAASELGAEDIDIDALELDLAADLASIQLFPEVIGVLNAARDRGLKLAIASNLAMPYAEPLLDLLPFKLDAYAWSFEVGFLKPDPRIFEWTCKRLGVAAEEALMVGDTFEADYEGARASGMRALHLDRDGMFEDRGQTVTTLDMLWRVEDFFQ